MPGKPSTRTKRVKKHRVKKHVDHEVKTINWKKRTEKILGYCLLGCICLAISFVVSSVIR